MASIVISRVKSYVSYPLSFLQRVERAELDLASSFRVSYPSMSERHCTHESPASIIDEDFVIKGLLS